MYAICMNERSYLILSCSSLSVWVKNVEAQEMPEDEREAVDTYIDQLYEDIDNGMQFVLGINLLYSIDIIL